MDDRLARLLLEDNILTVQKKNSSDIALLQKLAVQKQQIDLDITPGLPAEESNSLSWQRLFLKDDFVTGFIEGTISRYIVGNLNWNVSSDANVLVDGVSLLGLTQHYGIVQLKNQSTVDAFIYLSGLISPMVDYVQYIVGFDAPAEAGDGIILGLVYDPVASLAVDGTQEGIYFKYEFGDTNWQAVTNDSGTDTTTDTGVAFADTTWFMFEMRRTTGSNTWQFFINNVLVAVHDTNINITDALSPTFGMVDPDDFLAFGINIDYFAIQLTPFIQRWT